MKVDRKMVSVLARDLFLLHEMYAFNNEYKEKLKEFKKHVYVADKKLYRLPSGRLGKLETALHKWSVVAVKEFNK
jgi:hypothetical protein